MTREELTDLISDALGDSMDVDWNYATGARYVVDALMKEGAVKLEALGAGAGPTSALLDMRLAFEAGYRACERGENILASLASVGLA